MFSLVLHLKCFTGVLVEVVACSAAWVGVLVTAAAAAAVAYNLRICGAGRKEFPFTTV